MDVENLKHDPSLGDKLLQELEDGSVVAKRDFEIHLPKRFVDKGMATVEETVTTAVVLGLVLPGEAYASLVSLMDITLVPLSIREVAIKGTPYLVLEFTKGDTVIENTQVLQDSNKPYAYYMEFFYYAKLPWYVTENILSSMFDNARNESGSDVGSSPQVMRVPVSLMFRDPDNLEKPYRGSKAMLEGRSPVIVGLNNSGLLIDGTFPKLGGGYMRDNTLAAIVNPDTKVTDLEKVIKGVPTS
jgi:hypothetical protein